MNQPPLRDVLALSGTNAVVTGSSTGLSRRIAIRLAGAGARVCIVHDRSGEALTTIGQIVARGGEGHFIHLSGEGDDPAHRAVALCERTFGRVDLVVNNQGPRATMRAVARRMFGAQRGSIVQIDPIANFAPSASPIHDDGSRAALAVMTEKLAISRYEICCDDAEPPPSRAQRAISSALSRYVERGDVATATVCLASRAASGFAGARVMI